MLGIRFYVPNLRFPRYSNEWRKGKLKECAHIFDGTHQTPLYKKEGIRFVSVEDINNLYESNKYISDEAFISEFKIYPEMNDLLMTRIGDIGTPAIVSSHEPLAYYVSLALIKTKLLNAQYLSSLIQSRTFQHELWKKTIHVAFPKKINKEEIGECYLYFTNKDEQEQIGHFLAKIDERIEVQNKIINNLLSLKKTINNVLFEAYSPSIIFKECYLKAKEGGTPDTNNKLFYEHGTIPFAKIDDLSGKYIASTKSYISEKGLVKSSAWLIPAQSVLLLNGATIGECSITQCVLCTKQGIVGIIPSEIITSDFMYYFFKTNKFRKLIVRITTRGTMETAYIKDIEKIRIPLPKKDEQIRHAKIMNSFEHKIDNEKRILEHLLTQKKFFLNNLFI